MFEDYRGFPQEASTLIYASFFTWAAAGLFFISLQVFLLLEGVSFTTSSLILGTFGIVSASSTLLFGGLADRFGKKKFVLAGGILSALSLAIFAVDTNVPHLFGEATLAGLSEASFASSWSALPADKSRKSQTDKRLRPIILRSHNLVSSGRLQHQSSGLGDITVLFLTAISYFWRSFKDVKLPEEQVIPPLEEPIATSV